MDSLYQVKKSCFEYTVGENYKEDIKKFEDDWIQLNIEYGVHASNKCHIIFTHLEQFIERQKKAFRGIQWASSWSCTSKTGPNLAMVLCKNGGKRKKWWTIFEMYKSF